MIHHLANILIDNLYKTIWFTYNILNTLCIHLTLVYMVFYVPGIICRVSLASPTPIQLIGKMLMLYLFVFFNVITLIIHDYTVTQ